MFHPGLRVAAVVLVACSVAACNEPTVPDPLDLDDVLADLVVVEGFTTVGDAALGVPSLPEGRTTERACDFDPGVQRFVCPAISSGGLTLVRSFVLLDAASQPQSVFDPATTAGIQSTVDMTGTAGAGSPFALDVVYHSEQTLTGLLAPVRSLVGEATTVVSRVTTAGADTVQTTTTSDLAMPRRTALITPIYPTGTVTTVLTGSGLSVDQIVLNATFDGTSTMTMAIDLGSLSQTCVVKLDQPDAPPSCTAPGAVRTR